VKKGNISINRAPVLTLWAVVVARRLGFRKGEALTLGKAVAGLNAQAKGQRLGIYSPKEEKPKEAREKRKKDEGFLVEVCGRTVPAKNTEDGIRATKKGEPIDPESVERYLDKKFGDDLDRVEQAMQKLAKAYKPKELADEAYPLYEQFRPEIPSGKKGWGAEGDLDLGFIEKAGEEEVSLAGSSGSIVGESPLLPSAQG
jgi:hypothetical protein